jgi:hypothetical protein
MQIPQNTILDLLISITLIYALLSILVSIAIEWWNNYIKARGAMLKKSIEQLLKDPFNHEYGYLFYNHTLVSGMKSEINDCRPPQYISSSNFADVLIDVIAKQIRDRQPLNVSIDADGQKTYTPKDGTMPTSLEGQFNAALMVMNPSPFRDILINFRDRADGKLEGIKPLMEAWFNDYMDRVTGWYKRIQRRQSIFFGFLVAILLNADSLHLIKVVSLDPNLRNKLVNMSQSVADNYVALADKDKMNDDSLIKVLNLSMNESVKKDSSMMPAVLRNVKDSLSKVYIQKADDVLGITAGLNIPVGWSSTCAPVSWFSVPDKVALLPAESDGLLSYLWHRNNDRGWNIFKYILGICITGFSLSFGAPFWFELLVKFVNVRRSGTKPENTTQTKK